MSPVMITDLPLSASGLTGMETGAVDGFLGGIAAIEAKQVKKLDERLHNKQIALATRESWWKRAANRRNGAKESERCWGVM